MKLTNYVLSEILKLLPDFNSYQDECFDFQIHKTEQIVFTLPRAPEGIPVQVLVFKKNYEIQDWECEIPITNIFL